MAFLYHSLNTSKMLLHLLNKFSFQKSVTLKFQFISPLFTEDFVGPWVLLAQIRIKDCTLTSKIFKELLVAKIT